MIRRVKRVAKFIAAIIGSVLAAGTGLIPEDWAPWLGLVVAAATGVATYAIPNGDDDEDEEEFDVYPDELTP